VIERWEWTAAEGPSRLERELTRDGIAWLSAAEIVEAASHDPWAAATALLGERPLLLEKQPIRAVPGGRSFASGSMAAPFHSDSQQCLGVPPHVQVMACRNAASAGGESLYLDTWSVLERIAAEDPDLLGGLFETSRSFPFVFGDLRGTTLSLRGGSLVFTHTAFPEADDAVAARLWPYLERVPAIEVRALAGDVIVIHNHRMLHGRRAFDDPRREFVRLLVWRHAPYLAPAAWQGRARVEGGESAADPEARRRLGVVLELLRGVPPGMLSLREGISEPQLYSWRDAALATALRALRPARED
jgi:gamma-butyrobetaine dioxygenase